MMDPVSVEQLIKLIEEDETIKKKGAVINDGDPVISALVKALVERAQYLDEVGLEYLISKLKTIYVQQIPGKGLSTNDFTNEYKNILDGLEGGGGSGDYLPLTGGNLTGNVYMVPKKVGDHGVSLPGIFFGPSNENNLSFLSGDEGELSIGYSTHLRFWITGADARMPHVLTIDGTQKTIVLSITVNGTTYYADSSTGDINLGSLSGGSGGDYLPISGGTLTGDLRIKGSGNFGTKINLGDGDYVHISEPTDDNMEIKAKNITLYSTSGSSPATLLGSVARYVPLSFSLNGSIYYADSAGLVNLGTISGGASGDYLPLSGGTLTGDLTLANSADIYMDKGGYAYFYSANNAYRADLLQNGSTFQISMPGSEMSVLSKSSNTAYLKLTATQVSGINLAYTQSGHVDWKIRNSLGTLFIEGATHKAPIIQKYPNSSSTTYDQRYIPISFVLNGTTYFADITGKVSFGTVRSVSERSAVPQENTYDEDTDDAIPETYILRTKKELTEVPAILNKKFPDAPTGSLAMVPNALHGMWSFSKTEEGWV